MWLTDAEAGGHLQSTNCGLDPAGQGGINTLDRYYSRPLPFESQLFQVCRISGLSPFFLMPLLQRLLHDPGEPLWMPSLALLSPAKGPDKV